MNDRSNTLSAHEAAQRLPAGWVLSDDATAITRRFEYKNFADALAYVNALGAVAESANHHPDLKLGWGYVEVTFTTHDAGGLRDADFLMAAKADTVHG